MNTNNPFLVETPQRKDYSDGVAWFVASHRAVRSNLSTLKKVFDEYQDWFIELEDPTDEQAQEYRKLARQLAVTVGVNNSFLRETERFLKQFAPDALGSLL